MSNADSDLVGLGWDLRFFMSNQLPGDSDAAGPWTIILVVTTGDIGTSLII